MSVVLSIIALVVAIVAAVFLILAGIAQRDIVQCEATPQCYSNYICTALTGADHCPAKEAWSTSLFA